jgi:hypothetical protein
MASVPGSRVMPRCAHQSWIDNLCVCVAREGSSSATRPAARDQATRQRRSFTCVAGITSRSDFRTSQILIVRRQLFDHHGPQRHRASRGLSQSCAPVGALLAGSGVGSPHAKKGTLSGYVHLIGFAPYSTSCKARLSSLVGSLGGLRLSRRIVWRSRQRRHAEQSIERCSVGQYVAWQCFAGQRWSEQWLTKPCGHGHWHVFGEYAESDTRGPRDSERLRHGRSAHAGHADGGRRHERHGRAQHARLRAG